MFFLKKHPNLVLGHIPRTSGFCYYLPTFISYPNSTIVLHWVILCYCYARLMSEFQYKNFPHLRTSME